MPDLIEQIVKAAREKWPGWGRYSLTIDIDEGVQECSVYVGRGGVICKRQSARDLPSLLAAFSQPNV